MKHGRFQVTSLVPVYYWRGARPALVDLETHQTGWLVCLSLTREGDTCLLPLAWQENVVLDENDPAQTLPTVAFATEALDGEAVSLTLNDLRSAGWEVNGRITVYFAGRDTEPDFHQNNQTYLWHTPNKKEEL